MAQIDLSGQSRHACVDLHLLIDLVATVKIDAAKKGAEMNNSLPSLDISPPQVVMVAQGDTASHQANERGHLFEKFMARLFEAYGCETPTTQSLNVKQNGYELDISTRFKLSREAAIAECKAYSASLPISALNAFYGKLNTERLDNNTVHGWFVAIPGITSDALQLVKKLENGDSRFRYISANQIYELVRDLKWIEGIGGHRQNNYLRSSNIDNLNWSERISEAIGPSFSYACTSAGEIHCWCH